jgi:hypothetical protein
MGERWTMILWTQRLNVARASIMGVGLAIAAIVWLVKR